MPTIIILFLFMLTSCFEKKSELGHGLSKVQQSQFGYMGSVDRIIQLKLEVKNNKVYAFVTAPYTSNQKHFFKWKTNTSTDIISGQIEGQIQLVKNETQKIEIEIRPNQKLTHVGFEISGQNQNRRTFVDGIIPVDKNFESFEDIVQQVENFKKENKGDK